MSTVNATVTQNLTIGELFSAVDLPAAGNLNVTYDDFNTTKTLNAASTPPGTKGFAREYTSSQTLDLTAIVRDLGANLDCSGLKLQALLLKNTSTTSWLTVADSGSNTYQCNSGSPLAIPPGGRQLLYFDDELADVDATHKILTCQTTAGQKFQLAAVFG